MMDISAMLDKMPFNGQKAYIVGVATILYALGGMISGHMSTQEGVPLIMGALSVMSLRHAQAKNEAAVLTTPPSAQLGK